MKRLSSGAVEFLVVLAAALASRLILFAEFCSSPLFLHPVLDAAWHHSWATSVSEGNLFAFAPYFRAPLYPWALGAFYAFSGVSTHAGALFSMALSVAGCLLFHRLALRMVPRLPALAASLAWALWGPAVFYSSTLLIEPLYITLLIASMLQLVRGRLTTSALLLGLAAIARPGALLLVPLLVMRTGLKRSWRLLPFLIPVAAVWAVNASHGDPGVLISSQGGINLYIGNGPEADGMTAFAPAPPDGEPVRPDNVWSASVLGAPEGSSESEISSWWTGRAVASALEDPARWIVLTGRKILLLFSPVEIPGNYDLYYMRSSLGALKLLLLPFPVAAPFSLLLLLIPAVVLAGKPDSNERLLAAWTVLLLAGIVPFFVTSRFRLPAVPFLILLAAGRLYRRPPGILPLVAGAVLAVSACALSGGLVERSGVNMPFFDALAHVEEGDYEAAEDLFLQSLDRSASRSDLSMNRVEAMHDLGLLAARRGRIEEAREWWREALELSPGFGPSLEALAVAP